MTGEWHIWDGVMGATTLGTNMGETKATDIYAIMPVAQWQLEVTTASVPWVPGCIATVL